MKNENAIIILSADLSIGNVRFTNHKYLQIA